MLPDRIWEAPSLEFVSRSPQRDQGSAYGTHGAGPDYPEPVNA